MATTPQPAAPAGDVQQRASAEIQNLLHALEPLLLGFVDQAHGLVDPASANPATAAATATAPGLLDFLPPDQLSKSFAVTLPDQARGGEGLVEFTRSLLKHSANTWHQGFLSKLYGSTNAPGIASELILAFLNTNVHTYNVSPALSAVEKTTAKSLARLFGFDGPRAGGIAQPGGSGANLTALVTARNSLFPTSKVHGVHGGKPLVLFTSTHGHYSFEKAAIICGLGSASVISVDVDKCGRMLPGDLQRRIDIARKEDKVPFFVNATAGTTVLGSYDPLEAIAQICSKEQLWFHVDASWGGPAAFSDKHKHKLAGSQLADSLTVNPHKMMGVPITCSFLLGKDLRRFWKSNTLPAPYLFHSAKADGGGGEVGGSEAEVPEDDDFDVWDLADLTLQCGRKGDALKLALSWIYYGQEGFRRRIEGAFDVAAQLAALVGRSEHLTLVSEEPPPCLQVCFYVSPDGLDAKQEAKDDNSRRTRRIAQALLGQDFQVDYAPGEAGLFLRAVCSVGTTAETIRRLVLDTEELGRKLQ